MWDWVSDALDSIGEWFDAVIDAIAAFGQGVLDFLELMGQFIGDMLLMAINAIAGWVIELLIWLWEVVIVDNVIMPVAEQIGAIDEINNYFNVAQFEEIFGLAFISQLAHWNMIFTTFAALISILCTIHIVKHVLKLLPIVD